MKWMLMLMVAWFVVGCDAPARMTPVEVEAAVEGTDEIFVQEEGKWRLEEIPEFYLGQPEAEAVAALEQRCDAIVPYGGGWKQNNTVFKGCKLSDDPKMESIRIGFHPEAEMRVFTLEVKRSGWTAEQVRARFTQRFRDELTADVPRRGTIRMETPNYLMFGSWDDGPDGPGHVIFGYSPDAVKALPK